MKTLSLHRLISSKAQQGGFMPSRWSVCAISLYNDTPELQPGSKDEGWDG